MFLTEPRFSVKLGTVVNAIRYIVSAVANTLGSAGKKYVKGLLGC